MLADVWSYDIVLYDMLSGFLPFWESAHKFNKKIVSEGRIKKPKFFSEGAKNLLKHMLERNPLTRYALDGIIEHPLLKKRYYIIPGIIVWY